ncbi:hypothetical protein ACF08E_26175 [Streptomyces globisporus]|uniref:hypothetical protein n=1 Tax=Streptomyces globisporus TaxID=1908 RepID=UPI0036FC526D
MSVNGETAPNDTRLNGARYQAAKPCGREFLTLSGRGGGDPSTGSGAVPTGPAGRAVDRTDSRERAVLMRAFTTANTQLAAAQAELGAGTAKMLRSAERARGGIEAVERLTRGRSPARARRTARRLELAHATDGPEDLRRSSALWRKALLPFSLVIGAVFEAAFMATIVQEVIGAAEGSWEWWLAYLPGIGITVCLLAAGTLLAESVFRFRTRAERKPERRRTGLRSAGTGRGRRGDSPTEKRAETDLPWPNMTAPILLTVGILAMVAVWAYLRTARAAADHPHVAEYRPAVVALLLALSVSTVLAKVLAHNPYADRAERARKATEETEDSAVKLLKAARGELALHAASWSALRSATVLAENRAHHTLDDACIALVEERSRTGAAGGFDFPLGMTVWPYPADDERTGLPPADTLPRLRLEQLDEIREVLKTNAPSKLHDRLEQLAQLLNSQWEEADDDTAVRNSGIRETGAGLPAVRDSGTRDGADERLPEQPTGPVDAEKPAGRGDKEEPAEVQHAPSPGTGDSA